MKNYTSYQQITVKYNKIIFPIFFIIKQHFKTNPKTKTNSISKRTPQNQTKQYVQPHKRIRTFSNAHKRRQPTNHRHI